MKFEQEEESKAMLHFLCWVLGYDFECNGLDDLGGIVETCAIFA